MARMDVVGRVRINPYLARDARSLIVAFLHSGQEVVKDKEPMWLLLGASSER